MYHAFEEDWGVWRLPLDIPDPWLSCGYSGFSTFKVADSIPECTSETHSDFSDLLNLDQCLKLWKPLTSRPLMRLELTASVFLLVSYKWRVIRVLAT